MSTQTTTAYRRLLATATIGALAWTFACRPAWSPDSSQIVYPGKVGEKLALARYDLKKKTSEVLFVAPVEKQTSIPVYLDSGELMLMSNKPGETRPLVISRLAMADGKVAPVGKPLEVRTDNDALDHLVLPPVVVGNTLFLGGKSLTKIDLTTQKVVRGDLPDTPNDISLARRGDGICYLTTRDKDKPGDWELGTLDPETLIGKVLIRGPKASKGNPGWKPMPMIAFSRDLSRVAMPAERVDRETTEQTQTAILVFNDGKLENVLPLSDIDNLIQVSSLAFGADNVSVFTVFARENPQGHAFHLFETTFSGSVQRETLLLELPPTKTDLAPAVQMQLALSPDGKWAAVATAYIQELRDQSQSLLLVDISGKGREVQRIAFPEPAKKK